MSPSRFVLGQLLNEPFQKYMSAPVCSVALQLSAG